MALQVLQNDYWQVGVLPETGASLAFGRVRKNNAWLDVLRPTPEASYGNSSQCASFIMLPWCNRIRDGILRFKGQEYQLRVAPDDGTARHGDVRNRPWKIERQGETFICMSIDSRDFPDMNWPFHFSAQAEYQLQGDEFMWRLSLKNTDDQPMPGGFGYHPYFVRPGGADTPQVQIPCDHYFPLKNYLATSASQPIPPVLDFRRRRPLDERELNDLLTGRIDHDPARIVYPARSIDLHMICDRVFEHFLIFTPSGKPFFALEPMSNANDGFNLYEQGLPDSGILLFSPGEEITGQIWLRVNG